MPTPRTQNRRSSDADRSTTLACVPWRIALIALILAVVLNAAPVAAQIALAVSSSTSPAGVTIAGGSANFGTLDALNLLDSPSLNVSSTPVSGSGTLYYTPFNLTVSGMNGSHRGTITATSVNFTHSGALVAQTCPTPYTGCTAPAQFSSITVGGTTLGTNVPNSTVTAGLAVWVPEINGSTAYAGSETISITFTVTESGNGRTASATLSLTAKTQTVMQFTLGSASFVGPSGGSPDYTVNFGNVNGLGIGAVTTSVSGGVVYSIAYTLNPVFAEFSSTTATIKVQETSTFTYSSELILQDATGSGGPFSAIGISSPTTLTTTAASRASIPHYLGLFVSSANGLYPRNFINNNGLDSATLTFTLTVP